MRVISNRALTDFAAVHPLSDGPLQAWRRIVESRAFLSFSDLKSVFNATDKVGDFYVFDIGGNKYRVITAIHFNTQSLFIRYVLTHKEYDKWKP